MFTYSIETINGKNFYTGTTTMIERTHGTIFVWINRSAPKALQDIARPSKQLKNLLAVFEADGN